MMNEKQSEKIIARREFAILHKDDRLIEFDSTSINKNQQSHEIKIIEELFAPFENLEDVSTTRESSKHVSHIY